MKGADVTDGESVPAKMTTNVAAEEVPESKAANPVKQQIVWTFVVLVTVIHLLALYGIVVVVPLVGMFDVIWHFSIYCIGILGITAGVHRYWSHKSYKAKMPLRIILAAFYLTSGLNRIFYWVRDHRVHHKFSDTDADPHNASRGFFYSHVGWILQKKHPEVLRRGKHVDMSDVLADPVVQFEEKYFWPLFLSFAFLIPISVPRILWGQMWWISINCNTIRWAATINAAWSINSFAHMYGNHPYNREINPGENNVLSALTLGEGWHNYHHTFPWDYKTGELGDYGLNFTTAFIDFFAYIGWSYDLKQPSKEFVHRVVEKLGDGSHTKWGHVQEVPEEDEHQPIAKQKFEEMLIEAKEKANGI